MAWCADASYVQVSNKALQRDIMRHQTAASTTQDMLVQLQSERAETEKRMAALAHEKAHLLERVVQAESDLDALKAAAEQSPEGRSVDKSCQTAMEGEEFKPSQASRSSRGAIGGHRDGSGYHAYPDREYDAGAAPDIRMHGPALPPQSQYSPHSYPPSRYQPREQQHEDDGGHSYPVSAPPPGGYSSASLDSVVRKLRVMAEQLNKDE